MKNRTKSRLLLIAGIVFLAGGLLLLALGLDGLRAPVPCASNGCPSIFSGTYGQYWDEIYAGVAMIVVGIILIVASTKIKSRLETNPSNGTNPFLIRTVHPTKVTREKSPATN